MKPEFSDDPSSTSVTTRRYEAGHARLATLSAEGIPYVVLEGTAVPLQALSTIPLTAGDVGGPLLVMFIDGDPTQPVVIARLSPTAVPSPAPVEPATDRPWSVEADGTVVKIQAEDELVLECGQASVRLRKDGRIVLRGVDILSHASRASRIRGGTVAIN